MNNTAYMRYLLTALATCMLLTSCDKGLSPRLLDEGISHELATWRKATIKNLSYDLRFDIPDQRDEAIHGQIEICFAVKRRGSIIIDFRQQAEHILQLTANGHPVDYRFEAEHIILPKEAIVAGENTIHIAFIAGDQSVNRNDEFLYTLLVPDRARTLFPCFEQPDLKATFTLTLCLPSEWTAVSNTSVRHQSLDHGRKVVCFERTEPLSTYLFSFVAGRLQERTYDDGHHRFTAYYRESDPRRVAQLDTIFSQVASSIEWLEEYTGVEYPFMKYDFVILPGFQYGGMEHTGATLYNDKQMFLSEHPTPDEELRRIQLIAHETAHMWFGDYVTMAWFDDVWTKEVFANYFAARITEPLFPTINHDLNWLKTTVASSLAEDRTKGSTAIKQPLDNLRNAGLVYGNIIYNKAPVVMRNIVDIMGEEPFRVAIGEYLRSYAYGNATWEELIAILDRHTDADLEAFSRVWVEQRGMPHIELWAEQGMLHIRQSDPLGRDLVWPQHFEVTLLGERTTKLDVRLTQREYAMVIDHDITAIIPNSDGRGYGHFITDSASREWLLEHWAELEDDTMRQSAVMTLNENYHNALIDCREWVESLQHGIEQEHNALIASSLCSYIAEPLLLLGDWEIEAELYALAESHPITSCRMQLLRMLMCITTNPDTVKRLYATWQEGNHPLLSESDYMTLAYELALRLPQSYATIIDTTRKRLTSDDRRREFDYISRAVNPDSEAQQRLFEELLIPDKRRTEPWAATTLTYLNHHLRQSEAIGYIRPALEELQEVQRTGDIFFPSNWVGALLKYHHSEAASAELQAFLEAHPDYPQLLKNKILQAAK